MKLLQAGLVLIAMCLLAACAPAPKPPELDKSAIFTQAVATAYAELTLAPPTATAQPPLLIRSLQAAYLTELAWSPDGQNITAAACQETCQLNLYTLELSPVWSVEVAGTISYLEYSADGKLIAALVKNGIQSRDENGKILQAAQTEIWLFNAQDGAFVRKWDVEQAVMLRFNPLGTQIATAGGPVILWDVATGAVFWRLDPPALANNPGAVKLASLSQSPRYGGGPWCSIQTYDAVSFSPDAPILMIGGYGGGYRPPLSESRPKCYSVQGWHLVRNDGVGYNPILTSSSSDEFPVPQKLALQVTEVSLNGFSEIRFSGLLVMKSGFYPANQKPAYLLGLEQSTDQPEFSLGKNWGLDFAALNVTGAAISPGAERAAVWGQTPADPPAYFLNLFDARTAQQIAEVRLESDPTLGTFSAAFSPDGRMLASIDRAGTLSLWRVKRTSP